MWLILLIVLIAAPILMMTAYFASRKYAKNTPVVPKNNISSQFLNNKE
jgi:LPS O-antigen subunit length determinant protein (WzzB/FepE family)